jgi:hypothetical protein
LTVGDDIAGRDGEVLFRIRSWPLHYEGAPGPQTLRLVVNTEVIGEHPMPDSLSTLSFHIRPGLLQPGPNEIGLQFGYTKAPKDCGGPSGDNRQLAAAVDWIELEPVR